ncbi:FHA domain-containing protein [Roseimaritima ulvae]|uniref:FHA domain protein n=1 Tax=Roseimaritima ulvae TaxID=980254 RepID=A0A5B9R0D3_9BACT|nr:FHA domain-containing protein [Roseimaritima ulvae]QEG39721.1 FHA domain protein [Roseimaritima ulvae]
MPACPVCNAALLAAGGICPACGAVNSSRDNAAPVSSSAAAGGAPTAASAPARRTAIEVFPDAPRGRGGRHVRREDEAKETMLEPVPEALRQAATARRTAAAAPQPAASTDERRAPAEGSTTPDPQAAPNAAAAGEVEPLKPDTTPIFRPVRRPPVPRLIAVDDGQLLDGEVWRLRRSRTIIGRAEGDILIAGDPDISGKHIELACVPVEGGMKWRLTDLNSTNGTFVRVNRAPLADGKELILASHRYRFHMPAEPHRDAEDIRATRLFAGNASEPAEHAVWLELLGPNRSQRFDVPETGATIGADASQCELVPARDPFLSPMHARISRVRDRWQIEDVGSVNGTWMRIDRVMLDQDAEFQIGEQRFRFLLSRDDSSGM